MVWSIFKEQVEESQVLNEPIGKYNMERKAYLLEKLSKVDAILCPKCKTPMVKVGDSIRGEYV